MKRHHQLLCGIIVLLFLVLLLLKCSFGTVQSNTPLSKNPIGYGIFDGCLPGDPACLNDLDVISQKSFVVVLNYAALQGSISQINVYAARAQSDHVKIIWSFKDFIAMTDSDFQKAYLPLLKSCGCTTRLALVHYVVSIVKLLPVTKEYYLADEPTDKQYSEISALAQEIHKDDPLHKRLLIISGALGQTFLPLYTAASFVDVIGLDYYPIGRSSNPQQDIQQIPGVVKNLQTLADQHHKQTVVTLQAHSLSQNPAYQTLCKRTKTCLAPTIKEMEQESQLTKENARPTMIMWYSYQLVITLTSQLENLAIACKNT